MFPSVCCGAKGFLVREYDAAPKIKVLVNICLAEQKPVSAMLLSQRLLYCWCSVVSVLLMEAPSHSVCRHI